MNLVDYAKTGLPHQKEDLKRWGGENKIEETLFFYPLIGMLNNMAREIYKLRNQNSN